MSSATRSASRGRAPRRCERDCSRASAGEMCGSIPDAGRRHRVDGDVAERQPGVVRLFEREDRLRAASHRLREIGVRRPEVGEAGRRPRCSRTRGRARVEVAAALVNFCAASFEPTTLPSRSIRLPSALFGERDLGEAGDDERVGEPEARASARPRRERAPRGRCSIRRERLHERAERERREDHQAGGQRTITPTSRTTNVGAVGAERSCRGRGRSSSPASEPPSASAAISGTKRPSQSAIAPTSAENSVAP